MDTVLAQAIEDFASVCLLKEVKYVARHYWAHIRHFLNLRLACGLERIERAEVLCQGDSCRLTHISDTERVKKTWQRRCLAVLDGFDQLCCRLLAHALQAHELLRVFAPVRIRRADR